MKTNSRHLAAALFATGAASLAAAQATMPTLDSLRENTRPEQHQLADQTFFSVAAGTHAENLALANTIAEALAADASLKNSKITVAHEPQKILLTGVTPTVEQMARAVSIATELAGEGNVVNGIATEQLYLEAG